MKTLFGASRVLPFLIVLILAGTAGFACWKAYGPTSLAPAITEVGYGQPSGAPAIGGPFRLTNDAGKPVTEQTLVGGKYHLIFFGFASCPDICPGMLQLMAGVEEKLPQAVKEKLQFVFVSVDPTRDSLAKLGAYVRGFSASFVGWTGEKTEIDKMVKNYLAYYAVRAPTSADKTDYMVDHSGFAYLMGPDGKYMAHFRSSDSATSLQTNLETYVK